MEYIRFELFGSIEANLRDADVIFHHTHYVLCTYLLFIGNPRQL